MEGVEFPTLATMSHWVSSSIASDCTVRKHTYSLFLYVCPLNLHLSQSPSTFSFLLLSFFSLIHLLKVECVCSGALSDKHLYEQAKEEVKKSKPTDQTMALNYQAKVFKSD